MSGVNKAILIGNLGKDPDVKVLENGSKVANFPIATSETYKNREGKKTERTEWHNIVMWRNLADIAEKYLNKGKKVFIEGRIRTRQWEDKEGNKRYITEIVADNLTMLSTRKDDMANNNSGDNMQPYNQENSTSEDTEDNNDETNDLPF